MEKDLNNDEYDYLINHCLLPRKIEIKDNDQKNDHLFFKLILESISQINKENNLDFFKEIIRIFEDWSVIQNSTFLKKENIERMQQNICKLMPDQLMPLYLREQNATVILEKKND